MNFNYTAIAGNLVADPELSYTSKGTAITNFTIANNTSDDKTTFLRCVAFGKRAEAISKYLSKGNPILVEGKLQENRWTDQSGEKKSYLQLMVNAFHFLNSKSETQADPDF